jgi:hypothetical protein
LYGVLSKRLERYVTTMRISHESRLSNIGSRTLEILKPFVPENGQMEAAMHGLTDRVSWLPGSYHQLDEKFI